MKDFKKENLESGLIVETRRVGKYLFLVDRFLDFDSAIKLSQYDNDLCLKPTETLGGFSKDYDIMAVYKLNNNYSSINKILADPKCLDLVWERVECKKLTVEQMKKMLEELTNERIEVVKDDVVSRKSMVEECCKYCSIIEECNGCKMEKECEKYGEFENMPDYALAECYKKLKELTK